MADQVKMKQLDLTTLPLQHLTQLKQQTDKELEWLTSSLQQLKVAQTKFQESGEAIDNLVPENCKGEVLIPLSSSMYVPGSITNVEKVLIDIGTGYYVELDSSKAKDYFSRKVKFVTEQIEKIQKIAQDKVRLKDAVTEVMEMKIQAQLSQQTPTANKA